MNYICAKPKTMIASIQFMEQYFPIYNRDYFNGELPKPRFELIRTKDTLGQFQGFKKFTAAGQVQLFPIIRLSIYYIHTLKELSETLIHEMIHYYIWYKQIPDRYTHGQYWKSIAARINQHGWSITPTTEIDEKNINPIFDKSKKQGKIIFYAFKEPNKPHWFTFISCKSSKALFRKMLEDNLAKKTITNYKISTGLRVNFPNYSICRTKCHGHYVSDTQLSQIERTSTDRLDSR